MKQEKDIKKVKNHCSHCLLEPECAVNNWCLYGEYDPCCPNMKEGRRQFNEFLKDYFKEQKNG